jgi:hypothetical protein
MTVINWIVDSLLFVAGAVVGLFVEPDHIEFDVLQMAVAIILIALFVSIATYAGYALRAMGRSRKAASGPPQDEPV